MTASNLLQEIRDICNGSSTTNLLDNTTLLRRINAAYEEIVAFIQSCDGLWQFDDTNFTNFPIATTTLVASQKDYTFASDVLEVEQASVLNSSGIWQVLSPIDRSQMDNIDPVEYQKTAGLPMEYDKQGNSLILYPAPAAGNVTLTNGLKVTFKRTAQIYTAAELTTGTKEPGFASLFHIILAWMSAIPWLETYLPAKVPYYEAKVVNMKKEITKHYGRRERDRRKNMTMKSINYV